MLISVAERLFAESGIDAVSFRQIATEARQPNNFAVRYRFESRDGLIQAVFGSRTTQMELIRGQMLAAMETSATLTDLDTLLRAICLPRLELRHRAAASYAGFLAQNLLRHNPPSSAGFPTARRRTSPERLPCCASA